MIPTVTPAAAATSCYNPKTAVAWFATGNKMSSDDSIDYQGQPVKLSKSYSDYDDYKDDPNNLAPGEADKVQGLVQSAANRQALLRPRADDEGCLRVEVPGLCGRGFLWGDSAAGRVGSRAA